MGGNSRFDILRGVRIDGRRGVGRHQSDALGNGPSRWGRRANHSKRLRVAFNHAFGALYTLQDSGKIAHCIGLGNVHGSIPEFMAARPPIRG
jgi:hypothetical protein